MLRVEISRNIQHLSSPSIGYLLINYSRTIERVPSFEQYSTHRGLKLQKEEEGKRCLDRKHSSPFSFTLGVSDLGGVRSLASLGDTQYTLSGLRRRFCGQPSDASNEITGESDRVRRGKDGELNVSARRYRSTRFSLFIGSNSVPGTRAGVLRLAAINGE